MAAPAHHPQTPAERLIALTIRSTWLLWLVGGLYIVGPLLGWTLAAMAAWRLYAGDALTQEPPRPLGIALWVWIASMIAMVIILWAGHANFSLGTGQTIKSTVGWAKGWALLALFPVSCAVLGVRIEVVARAICRLGGQSLYILPVFLIAPFVGLPAELWVSPLKIIGGSGPEYFAATLYTLEPGVGTPRWQFFAPWSPAAGMVAVIHVLLAMQEKALGWRTVGVVAGVLIAVLTQSRLALIALLLIIPVLVAMRHIHRPAFWLAASPALLLAGIFALPIMETADQVVSDVRGARADSTRVREALGRIAVERWRNEAPWFGHGIVENGPHLVEYMPIGSHHSWYGLLFVKGLLGALALAIPLMISLAILLRNANRDALSRTGFGLALVILLYSFGENLEMLAYITWPAWAMIGPALMPQQKGR